MKPWRLRLMAWAVCAALLAAAALAWGALNAQTTYAFGPHAAVYEVTTDGRLTVDLGPLGTVIADSPVPSPWSFVGLTITVGEIPDSMSSVPLSVAELVDDLSEYAQFFGAMDTVTAAVRHGLILDALRRAAVAWALTMGLAGLVWFALGVRRRNEGYRWVRRHQRLCAGLAAAVVFLGGGSALGYLRSVVQGPPPVEGSPAFAGTSLEGARVTGRLGQVLDYYGVRALGLYKDNESFYDRAAQQVGLAFAAQQRDLTVAAVAGVADGAAGAQTQAAGRRVTEGGDGTDPVVVPYPEATSRPEVATPAPLPDWEPLPEADRPWLTGPSAYAGLRPVLMVTDLHCNVGLASVIGAVARASGAVAVFDGGDMTADGTAVEAFCVDAFAQAVPDGVPLVVVTGNHDTALTAKQADRAGDVVLEGEIIEVAGLRVLGDSDPTHTEIARGTVQVRDETEVEMGQRLAGIACEAAAEGEGPAVLLVHNPLAGLAALEQGCVPLALSGHTHQRSGPERAGQGWAYTASSTGKDVNGTTPIGPLVADSELTLLLFDQASRLVGWQLVTVHPDASVTLGAVEALGIVPAAGD